MEIQPWQHRQASLLHPEEKNSRLQLPHTYSVASAECLATLTSPNRGDVYTPDVTHLVTGMRLWDIAPNAVVNAFRGHFASVRCSI
ncbi:unnamed protein product [Peronospora destructor]|uniref:Uncharacterized protein n=1 Tax=Peronospora destructor TaxID=86335 RepID=A0AAV0TGZ1_9STRA|nr:unnamed protein product [Peronospora destructor]